MEEETFLLLFLFGGCPNRGRWGEEGEGERHWAILKNNCDKGRIIVEQPCSRGSIAILASRVWSDENGNE